MDTEDRFGDLLNALRASPEFHENVFSIYIRLWQLETWLRRIVNVEFRAKYGVEWSAKFQNPNSKHAYGNDQALPYMPSIENTPISYVTFGNLVSLIDDEWALFEAYLPPQDIWDAKIREIKQIRNRVAHFRRSHKDDLQRVEQLLRDMDMGIWNFVTEFNSTSLTSSLLYPDDPIISEYWYLSPFAETSLPTNEHNHSYAHLKNRVSLNIEINQRNWEVRNELKSVAGQSGYLYDVRLTCRYDERFDYECFLKNTKSIHPSAIFLCIDTLRTHSRVILPAVLGADRIIEIMNRILSSVPTCLRSSKIYAYEEAGDSNTWVQRQTSRIQQIADKWPENVLGPQNPITFLDNEMPCSIFNV